VIVKVFSRQAEAAKASEAEELSSAFRECRAAVPYVILLGCLSNLLFIVPALFVMQLYDRVISSGRLETLVLLLLMAIVAAVFIGYFESLRQLLLSRVNRWLDRRLTATLISSSVRGSLLGLPPSNQPLQDLQTLRSAIGGPIVFAFTDMIWAPLFIVVVWLLHPLFGLLGVISVAISFSIMLLSGRVSRRTLQAADQSVTSNMVRAETAIRNADVFQALGMLPAFITQWNERNEPALAAQAQASTYQSMIFGLQRFVRTVVQLLIMAIGCYLVIQGELAGGAMMAGGMLLYRALGPVEQTVSSWRQFVAARDAYHRLNALLSLIPKQRDSLPLPKPRGQLSCEGIFYSLANRPEPILNGVQFNLNAGEVLGVIGPSASGKSTLCRLIVGIVRPVRGRIRLDGADVFAWSSDQLGPLLGYVPQDVELFEGTVSSNIARLDSSADPVDIVQAAKAAGAHEMILRLPDGYETEVGARGSRLSGGQRQRIALARALFRRPSLIVLDEPNANLDGEGELALINAINTAKQWGATIILVAHQPHIMKPADKLLVLRRGKAEMFGPREDVLRNLRSVPSKQLPRQPEAKPSPAPVAIESSAQPARR
jgi:PrtD family type I secretion system ABC transporter